MRGYSCYINYFLKDIAGIFVYLCDDDLINDPSINIFTVFCKNNVPLMLKKRSTLLKNTFSRKPGTCVEDVMNLILVF